jgi:catechol 2,3-dioxygenase-like lactoylglutathione lyase family enzyme
MTNRRTFLKSVPAFAAVLGLHANGRLAAQKPSEDVKKAEITNRFRFLRLQTSQLEEMRQFYVKTLGVTQHAKSERSFTATFGATRIEFQKAERGSQPFYHFAFNVPENKFAKAKSWLAERCPLLKDSRTGQDELFFDAWNAHAVYFRDPGGNIGELIARHTLANARDGEFGVDDLLCASEIGLVSDEPAQLVTGIGEAFGLKPYLGNSMFVGDEHGLFVLPPVGRPWIPDRQQNAAVFPVEMTIDGHDQKELRVPNLPYVVRGQPA